MGSDVTLSLEAQTSYSLECANQLFAEEATPRVAESGFGAPQQGWTGYKSLH